MQVSYWKGHYSPSPTAFEVLVDGHHLELMQTIAHCIVGWGFLTYQNILLHGLGLNQAGVQIVRETIDGILVYFLA